MAIELSTAGIKVGWGVEAVKGTKPTQFVRIRGLKSIPSFNPEPATLQVTDLNDTEWHRYIDGLKDLGGALAFTANLSKELFEDWENLYTAYETAKATELRIWFHIYIPGLDDGFFLTGNPSPLGMPEASVDGVLETDVYVTPTYVEGWSTKIMPTEPV